MFSYYMVRFYHGTLIFAIPKTHKHLNYFKYSKNNTLSKNTPLLQKIKLDKIQQEGLIWGHRGWVWIY